MYILTEDGDLHKGFALSTEEAAIVEHYKENLDSVGYISSRDKSRVLSFLLLNYTMALRQPPAEPEPQPAEEEKIGLTCED